jgi:hypothetical protein
MMKRIFDQSTIISHERIKAFFRRELKIGQETEMWNRSMVVRNNGQSPAQT